MQTISFTCLPHFQLCAPFCDPSILPMDCRESVDALAAAPGAADALAYAFEGFEYSKLCKTKFGDLVEEYQGNKFDEFVASGGVGAPAINGLRVMDYAFDDSDPNRIMWWVLYVTEKHGFAARDGVIDTQMVRLVWRGHGYTPAPVWVANWSFSNNQFVDFGSTGIEVGGMS